MCPERGCGLPVPVGGEIVENDHRAGGDLRDQNLPDICREGGAIHCALDDPRCDQGLMGQPGDQGLGPPTAKRGVHGQSRTTRAPASQAGKIRFHRRFVKKDNTFRRFGDGGQAMPDPIMALFPYLRASAFNGHQ